MPILYGQIQSRWVFAPLANQEVGIRRIPAYTPDNTPESIDTMVVKLKIDITGLHCLSKLPMDYFDSIKRLVWPISSKCIDITSNMDQLQIVNSHTCCYGVFNRLENYEKRLKACLTLSLNCKVFSTLKPARMCMNHEQCNTCK